MRENLTTLAIVRQQQEQYKAAQAECETLVQATPEYKALLAAQQASKEAGVAVSAFSDAVREAALEAFRATGDKAPEKGVAIKMYKVYRYDSEVARLWCISNAPGLLALDSKRFEKAAELLPDAPVTIESDPRPTIASDLGEYLA